ncbi:hypothetical protein [Nitrosomonas aestuarii]|nr:hypothetical protein [Nitrosomonas aestuarii]
MLDIQRIKLVLEAKAVTWRQILVVTSQLSMQRFIQVIGLIYIHVGKTGSCQFHRQDDKGMHLCTHAVSNITQADAAG